MHPDRPCSHLRLWLTAALQLLLLPLAQATTTTAPHAATGCALAAPVLAPGGLADPACPTDTALCALAAPRAGLDVAPSTAPLAQAGPGEPITACDVALGLALAGLLLSRRQPGLAAQALRSAL